MSRILIVCNFLRLEPIYPEDKDRDTKSKALLEKRLAEVGVRENKFLPNPDSSGDDLLGALDSYTTYLMNIRSKLVESLRTR